MKTSQVTIETLPCEPPSRDQRLASVRTHALAMIEHMQALASDDILERYAAWNEQIGIVQSVVHFIECSTSEEEERNDKALTASALQTFGKLLRDRRNAIGWSRLQLARRAKLSDATIKFIETARHQPSRGTLIRLIGISELNLTWDDVPTSQSAPQPIRQAIPDPVKAEVSSELNCFITPTYDPVRAVMDLGRFLNGAGGHVEQTNAYLDHQSAAAYIGMCQQSPVAASLRACIPVGFAAQHISEYCGKAGLNIIALGVGDGTLEVRLMQHLLSEMPGRPIELCLLDISQPLLSVAYKNATDALSEFSNVHIWGMQGNFHHLPLYTQLYYTPAHTERRRVFSMLGGTLANLDNEPRFFQHSLLGCRRGDLLLLDVQLSKAPNDDAEAIMKYDRTASVGVSASHQSWFNGPIWRHCKDVTQIDYHWRIDQQCPVPGSYALDAIATVKARGRADRQFSMFRFKRYEPTRLREMLESLGWDQLASYPYGIEEKSAAQLLLYRKRNDP